MNRNEIAAMIFASLVPTKCHEPQVMAANSFILADVFLAEAALQEDVSNPPVEPVLNDTVVA